MRILIVGGGAVGQVLGLALRRAGVDLAFFARPAAAARLRQALDAGGLPLTRVSRRRAVPLRLDGFQVFDDVAAARAFAPAQIWFTTPSPVYYTPWFAAFLQQVPARRALCFAPEGDRPEFRPAGLPAERLLFGGITFMAWQGALGDGGVAADGVPFWLPPLLAMPVIGPPAAAAEVAALLRDGGLRAAVRPPAYGADQAALTAVLTAFVAGLELAGWSPARYRRDPALALAARAAREGVAGQRAGSGRVTRALLAVALSRPVFALATLLLPPLFPFDLQAYLRFHYLKTRPQTLALLDLFSARRRRARAADARHAPAAPGARRPAGIAAGLSAAAPYSTRPWRRAKRAAWVRSARVSLLRMALT